MTSSRRMLLLIGVSASISGFVPSGWQAFGGSTQNPVNVEDGVAIYGYDTVSYFTEGKPTKGSPEFEYTWRGAKWQFASAAHRDFFIKQPEAYAPRFGGFCAKSMVNGEVAASNPNVWAIVDGKLYLNLDEGRATFWQKDPTISLKAEQHWKALIGQ